MSQPTVETAHDFEPFKDIETAVMDLLLHHFPDLATVDGVEHVATETPADLPQRLAGGKTFVRVELVDGRDDRFTDYATVDIDVYGRTRPTSRGVAEDIRAVMIGYPHRVGNVAIEEVITSMRPQRVPWSDGTVKRYYSSYRISAR